MEDSTLDNNYNSGGGLSDATKGYIREIAKWGKFLAIVGFIMSGLLVVLALFMGSILGAMSSGLGGMEVVPVGFITFFYILIAIIYIFPSMYLYKFSTKAVVALDSDDEMEMTSAFENLKSLFKFMGIFMIIILSFYAIVFVFALVGGALAG